MTAEERASHILEYDNVIREMDEGRLEDLHCVIVKHLEQAVDQAWKEGFDQGKLNGIAEGLVDGFAQARKMARDVVLQWKVCGPDGPRLGNGDLVIDRLASLQPSGEGAES